MEVDEVFSEEEVEVTEPVEEVEEQEVETTEEAEEETPASEEPEEPTAESGLQSALLAERRKRQDLEARLREQEEREEVPDPTYDPEGYAKHMDARAEATTRKIKIDLSRDLMLESHDDFEAKEVVFMDLLKLDENGTPRNVTLYEDFIKAPNPARFAYNAAKEHLEVEEIRSPNYREKLKAELLAEIQAELKGEESTKGKSALDIPSLTSATSVNSNSNPAEVLPENPSDLFD